MQKGVSRSGRPVSYKGDVRKFRVGQGSRYLQYGDGLPYSSLEEDKPIRGLSVVPAGEGGVQISFPMDDIDWIFGLGESFGHLNRLRSAHTVWTYDSWGYNRSGRIQYTAVPFIGMHAVEGGERQWKGLFVNSGSRMTFDLGRSVYNMATIYVDEGHFDIYTFSERDPKTLIEDYTTVTGKPFRLPSWALGHQVSRWSYYPDRSVMRVIDRYAEAGMPVSAVYLDIDYMEGYRVFTVDQTRFPDMPGMVNALRERGVRVVPIIDPGVKVDQNFRVFRALLGHYMEAKNGDIFTGKVWPGTCAFPDFLDSEARGIWSHLVSEFASSGYGGIWLDMNEPAVHIEPERREEKEREMSESFHRYGGERVQHRYVHNYYAYYQAMATYEGLRKVSDEPFILTRSGFSGIQRFAAVWTGDNEASWDDLRLQFRLVLSLGLSGIPYSGCDIGGFMGDTSAELLVRYYQAATFFPFMRIHKVRDSRDHEPFNLPEPYRERVRLAIETRYKAFEYMRGVMEESVSTGLPMLRPLFLEYPGDRECYLVEDEAILGAHLLHAPIMEGGKASRDVYLPDGTWIEVGTGRELSGGRWVESHSDNPVFLRSPVQDGLKGLMGPRR
ncbi:alpha-glucosidase [Thermogymnomonas acidicola]|uniref:Alpha-glucosidase n=1 Tax=Thermogymnomonas acidicola TaxID=399579 RepID=A0AA37BQH3_9ARCH|nr:TIM-barrel domain-containing protein [Thermogymnomonas acidicola]GGM69120.1 alpha-glucosidase [Thermogymnomonas acidicola]